MRGTPINVGYDPVPLSEALVSEFTISDQEVFQALENLGLATEEKLVWLLDFSLVFSTTHPEVNLKGLEGLKFDPEFYKRYLSRKEEKNIDHRSSEEGFDDRKIGRSRLTADKIPEGLMDFARSLSILGLSVIALESSRYMFVNGEYNHFVSLLMATRELFTSWKLSQKGIADKKRVAKANALRRHVETYQLRDEVIEYWKANISLTLSNEKAANLLVSRFPLSHRKLNQYIAEAKRKGTSC
ncbi:MAG: hypothetical protein ABI167_04550 [Nitrosospira sp.]